MKSHRKPPFMVSLTVKYPFFTPSLSNYDVCSIEKFFLECVRFFMQSIQIGLQLELEITNLFPKILNCKIIKGKN